MFVCVNYKEFDFGFRFRTWFWVFLDFKILFLNLDNGCNI